MRKKLNLSIESWAAWSPSKSQRSNWVDWAQGASFSNSYQGPDVSQVPPMKRRRMSQLSKMAYFTAHSCLSSSKKQPICVFASQHGELTRTVKILNSLAGSEDVSPTDFSLSVHNTALGLFSINTKNKLPATTVAAGDDTFGYGFVEAYNLLARYQDSSVLLVYFDEPLPEPISHQGIGPQESVSIALLLTRQGDNPLSFRFEPKLDSSSKEPSLAQDFLKFYLSNTAEQTTCTEKNRWHWQKS